MKQKFGIVLAAGKGTRMKSTLYKVMHPICGKPMVEHVIDQLEKVGTSSIVTIVGNGAEMVKERLGKRSLYAFQEEQLGTGHAVLQAEELLKHQEGVTVVVCGDTPLITAETLQNLMRHHEETAATATILTAHLEDPTGYGRIVRQADGTVLKNVEHKDASVDELSIQEVNTGTYCFENQALFHALHEIGNDNAQGEYYLPDVLEILQKRGERISAYQMSQFEEGMGVNDRIQLSRAEKLMRSRINTKHMENGVTLIDPEQTYIESDVEIGFDTVIEPGVVLKGQTIIGSHCYITSGSTIRDSRLEDHVVVTASMIEESTMKTASNAGPFAHLRPNTVLEDSVHIGNFVEIKNSLLGQRTKVGHLSYVGDADLGSDINVGCGTVFVNYDGKNKHRSQIGNHVFIGCNSNIVSPVEIGDDAFIAAGSTITKDVPAKALAIARAKQENKQNYATKLPALKKESQKNE